jgi:hypothetical protein
MFLGIALGRGMVGSIMAYAAYAANAQTPPFIADFVGGFYVANNQPTLPDPAARLCLTAQERL